ncbi:MAG: hypothetical protein JXQ90_08730 [Cyclobacteriaceae bacterium]
MKNVYFIILALALLGCTEIDGPVVPRYLEFEEIGDLSEPSLIEGVGMIGSSDDKHLFIVFRSTSPRTDELSEKVVRINTTNGEQRVQYNEQADFITKRPQIVDGRLVVVGGRHITIYGQNLDDAPEVIRHDRSLTRFGSAVLDNELIVWGGDLERLHSDKILVWDWGKNKFNRIGRMPGPKTWAGGAIARDRLYVFGGQQQFQNTWPENQIYKYNFYTKESETFFLPDSTKRTYSASQGHLIYVAGQIIDRDVFTLDLDILFGVFDTRTDQYFPVLTNLSSDQLWTIHQMCIVGEYVYILYGNEFRSSYDVKIMRARLPPLDD